MSEQRAIDTGGPVTVPSMVADLKALGVSSGSTLMVHASLSSMGWVCGGAQAVIQALDIALGDDGTLAMPAFSTSLTDPASWEKPPVPESWWQTIRDTMPAFDRNVTPTRAMGAVAELLRTLPQVLRSDHPNESVAARGPRAPLITEGHLLESPSGEGSPLARLYDLDARVLLLGVGHGSNSSMHLAEERAAWPSKTLCEHSAPMRVDGERRWVTWRALDYCSDDFARAGEAFPAQVLGKVGAADARLFSQRDVVDYMVGWIEANRT